MLNIEWQNVWFIRYLKFLMHAFVNGWLISCEIKAYWLHEGPRPKRGMPLMEVFPYKGSPHLCYFRKENTEKIKRLGQQVQPRIELSTSCLTDWEQNLSATSGDFC